MKRFLTSLLAIALISSPVHASAQANTPANADSAISIAASPSKIDENIDALNTSLEDTGANFRFNSIEGSAQDLKLELEYEDTTFVEDPTTGEVLAVNSDGTTESFSDNSINTPIGPDFGTSVKIIDENTIEISAKQSGFTVYANPFNMFGCVQNVLASATLLGTILGVTAVAAQALAAAGAAVAMAAAALYCSSI